MLGFDGVHSKILNATRRWAHRVAIVAVACCWTHSPLSVHGLGTTVVQTNMIQAAAEVEEVCLCVHAQGARACMLV